MLLESNFLNNFLVKNIKIVNYFYNILLIKNKNHYKLIFQKF